MIQPISIASLARPNEKDVKTFLRRILFDACQDVYPHISGIKKEDIHLEHPQEIHGDYASSAPLRIASELKEKPFIIAQKLQEKIREYLDQKKSFGDVSIHTVIAETRAVPPGFLNIFLTIEYLSGQTISFLNDQYAKNLPDSSIAQSRNRFMPQILDVKKIMVEFAHPNTHKEFHIGHLRNITIGESIVRLLKSCGATVFRANYEGDVGAHVAKAIWGIYKKVKSPAKGESLEANLAHGGARHGRQKSKVKSKEEYLEILTTLIESMTPAQKAKFLGEGYALGSKMYDEDENAKKEIIELNKAIYQDPLSVPLWKETRQMSLDYFDNIYKRLGTHFDRLFFESEVEHIGRKLVIDNIEKGIFVRDSDGSIYFPGEKFGLNNCVFVTRENYATYEGKDIALEHFEYQVFPYDLDIHVVANEQKNFFQIAFAALEQLYPYQIGKQFHLAYGMVKLKSGKMSSRTGEVITADWLIDEAKRKIEEITQSTNNALTQSKDEIEENAEIIAVAAVKYAMLRVNPKQDIAFDLNESVSLEGDSGPYLLYTYARCRSVMRKSKVQFKNRHLPELNQEESALLRTFYIFPEVVGDAAINLSPNLLCTYLFDLAQKYNAFYNKHSILGIRDQGSGISQKNEKVKNSDTGNLTADSSSFRLFLTEATAAVLQKGLYLLGIETVERM